MVRETPSTGVVDPIASVIKSSVTLAEPVETKLELANKLFQDSTFPHALKVAQGKRLPAPLIVDLDPTTFCDLACPECISMRVLHNGQFSQARLVQLAEELAAAHVHGVILIGGGEPLMHKAIGKVIETLHRAGVKVGMVTNGTLINRYMDAMATQMSWIRVSMDAATQETYDKFRPSGRAYSVFPHIIENMRQLAQRKVGTLGYSFLLMQRRDTAGVVTDSNYNEVFAAGKLARDIGCDYFEIKAMFDDGHYIVDQSKHDIALVEEQLQALHEIETDNFKLLASSTWTALKNSAQRTQPKTYQRCRIAELRTTLTPTGVYTCAYHRGNPKARLGDVQKFTLTDMWAKADTSIINPAIDCGFHCARHDSNLVLESLPDNSEGIMLHPDYDPFI